MGRFVDIATWDERRAWIEKQQHGGLSIAAFCREHELDARSFHAWKRRFSLPSPVGKKPQSTSQQSHSTVFGGSSARTLAIPQSAFVQVATQATAKCPWVEVSLADGMVVRVPASNLAALKLVLCQVRSTQEPEHD